jgi:hypothetical protein
MIKQALESHFDDYFGLWATERIVCVGDYAETRPPGLEDIQQELYDCDACEIPSLRFSLYSTREALDAPTRQIFDDTLSEIHASHFPADLRYVMLNFTAKQYVLDRSHAGDLLLSYNERSPIQGFGDLVISQILWSQDPWTSLKCDVDVEGSWAGHRFAIITLSVFDQMTNGRQGWTNVTDKCWQELSRICVADPPYGWLPTRATTFMAPAHETS